MASLGTLETILAEVGQALLPLRTALRSPERFFAFMLELGWQADDIPQPLRDLGNGLDALVDALTRVLGGSLNVEGSVRADDEGGAAAVAVNADDVARLLQALQKVIAGIRGIATAPDAAIPAPLRADGFKTKFPKQLVDYLVVTYLTRYQPSLAFALRALGVVKATYTAPAGNRLPYVHYSVDLAELPDTLAHPAVVLEHAFGWGRDDFDFAALASQVDNLLATIGVDTFMAPLPTAAALAIEGAPDRPGAPRRKVLRAFLFHRARNGGRMAAELRLMPLPARDGLKPGLALLPAFNGLLDVSMKLGEDIAVGIRSDLDLQGGVALQVRPGRPIEVLTGFDKPGTPLAASGSIQVKAERGSAEGTPTVLLGAPGSTRLQFRKVGGLGGVRLDGSGVVDVFGEFDLEGLEFVLDASSGDGFIARLLPSGGLGFTTDLTLGVSHRDGFYFRGTAGLEISIPAHVRLGPVDVQGLTISAGPRDGALPISLGATLKGDLGPVKAVVENIGLTATFAFKPDHDGNLGPIDLSIGFKPPNGIGLSIDAGVVKGGGYLFIDAARGEYAGALELTFAEFLSLKAIGIITTKMPDGSKGFSLLVIISVEFGSGIQLGFGFTLLAVGGLVGLNRTMNLQALAEGVRSGAIESVMFPRDVVANAPKIISDLRAFFPPKEGTFLIGPMAKLGWGTPTLVSVSLGIVIEIPGNIAILGVLKVVIPADDVALIKLQVNFIGAIEFDKQRVWFFAALFDSRIVFLTIEGEMGLLVAWGEDANFVVSVGGFHPRFSPPPLPFPSPRRIAVSLLSSPIARVRIEGYFAVTSNTVQFGARVEVFFGLDALNVQGHLAFDALFQFSPFYFVIEISASLSVKVFGIGLFSVRLRGSLEGPAPWHIKGEGSISLLFFDIDVEFETTWGDRRDTQLPPIAVLPLLAAELDKAESWRALPPAAHGLSVTLRKLPAEEAALVLHPMGVLRVSQRAVPLELTLAKVGQRKPSDVNRLSVAATGGLARREDAFERFAPAQFQDFPDADKLSRPAFAPERSGLHLTAAGRDLRSSVMVKRVVRYEEIVIDSNFKRFQRRFQGLLGSLFDFFLRGGAVARCEVSRASRKRLQPFDDRIGVAEDTYTVAFQATNRAFAGETAAFASEASAREYLQRTVAANPALADELHVIPSVERAA